MYAIQTNSQCRICSALVDHTTLVHQHAHEGTDFGPAAVQAGQERSAPYKDKEYKYKHPPPGGHHNGAAPAPAGGQSIGAAPAPAGGQSIGAAPAHAGGQGPIPIGAAPPPAASAHAVSEHSPAPHITPPWTPDGVVHPIGAPAPMQIDAPAQNVLHNGMLQMDIVAAPAGALVGVGFGAPNSQCPAVLPKGPSPMGMRIPKLSKCKGAPPASSHSTKKTAVKTVPPCAPPPWPSAGAKYVALKPPACRVSVSDLPGPRKGVVVRPPNWNVTDAGTGASPEESSSSGSSPQSEKNNGWLRKCQQLIKLLDYARTAGTQESWHQVFYHADNLKLYSHQQENVKRLQKGQPSLPQPELAPYSMHCFYQASRPAGCM